MNESQKNFTYIVKCKDNTYYCGWTNNLAKRLKAHNSGKGAKYTKTRGPVSLVYYEKSQTKEAAMSREWHIKQLSKAQKFYLCESFNNSMLFSYRIATQSDLSDVWNLVKQCTKKLQENSINQWDEIYPTQEDISEDINNNNLYVVEIKENNTAEINSSLLAIFTINELCNDQYNNYTWKDNKAFCILHRFCISPNFQGKGYSSKILNQIDLCAINNGYESIRLDVYSQNPAALHIYNQNGYTEIGTAEFRKGKFLLMEKCFF